MSARAAARARGGWVWGLAAVVALAAVHAAAYHDFVGRFFAYDDFALLEASHGLQVRTPVDLLRFFEPWPSFAHFRPLTFRVYFWLGQTLFGTDPVPWTVAQLGLHVASGLLVYAIAARLLPTRGAALAAALIYACAPGHALAVRWISFVTVTGTALPYFAGLWGWLAGGTRRTGLALAAFVVALLCSEHAVSFPVAVTALAVLAEGRRDWWPLARELAPLWITAALYLAARLVLVYVVFPRRAPLDAELFRAAYAWSFSPRDVLASLGRYTAAAVAPLYAPGRSPHWNRLAGAWLVAVAALAVAAAPWTGERRRWLGVTACGLVLFLAGLAPVLALPQHVLLAYVGIGALGMALALVAPLAALPRGGAAALALAALVVGVHLDRTSRTVRAERDFQVVERSSAVAVQWLRTLASATGPDTTEVVVPLDGMTQRLFGAAHRIFLCASYRVRPVRRVASVPAAPGLVVLPAPSGPVPAPGEGWREVVRDCSSASTR